MRNNHGDIMCDSRAANCAGELVSGDAMCVFLNTFYGYVCVGLHEHVCQDKTIQHKKERILLESSLFSRF